jgi:hypothetical protein
MLIVHWPFCDSLKLVWLYEAFTLFTHSLLSLRFTASCLSSVIGNKLIFKKVSHDLLEKHLAGT